MSDTTLDDAGMSGPSTRMFQISEPDLCELERILPELIELGAIKHVTRHTKQWEKVKTIVSNVRWNYGPWTNVEEIPAGGDS